MTAKRDGPFVVLGALALAAAAMLLFRRTAPASRRR
jgi:hypothetical protein